MDFSLNAYRQLLSTFQSQGYSFQCLEKFMALPKTKTIILRHDVDKNPLNSLKMAQLENELGIEAVYYFRSAKKSWDETIMNKIAGLGHELGYHYEDLSLSNGNIAVAIQNFEKQLDRFRRIYPVKTICMHGSPLSKFDNRTLWDHYNYRDYGIVGEPYFDIDFNEVFYITDTGRKWNNDSYSVRDRVDSGFDIPVKSTFHFISLARENALPIRMMITVHPQRWHDNRLPWVKELLWQNFKNIFKAAVVKARG